ncbi:MAG: ABC transporter permease [Chitinivibrionia bacterium]|nr:ABC transporter permease [Chitinivibrionia bacterium]
MVQTIAALIRKELLQIRRDRIMLRLIFIMPLVQLLVLGYAVSTDVKFIGMAVHDCDRSSLSREFVRSFSAGDYFIPRDSGLPLLEIERGFQENAYDAVLIIPPDFSKTLAAGGAARAGFIVDGTNANAAAISLGYAGIITAQFNGRTASREVPISLRQKVLYNPEGESIYFMVPGIIAVLLTMITVMLTAMAIVRERELGTLEQLVVTPISTPALILGKTIPFAILGFVEMSIALAFGVLWFKIPFAGSWPLLYALAFIFLFTTLGVGMFISTATRTQQQAMFFSWFFSIYTILTSGFFIPIANMPAAVQYLTYLNPLRYFMKIVRSRNASSSSCGR